MTKGTSATPEENLFSFLEMAGSGCISGQVIEWPQLKPACKWAAKEISRLRQEIEAQQAMIDDLMLEYCPDDMNPEQLENWAKNQSEEDRVQKVLEELTRLGQELGEY